MKIKVLSKVILSAAFFLLCVSAVSADALLPDSENEIPENSTQIDVSADDICSDEYEEYTEVIISEMTNKGYSSADYEITSIYPLYEIYSYDEPHSFMYDIKCDDDNYYSMLIECSDSIVSVLSKRQSLQSKFVEENDINPDNIMFIFELFGAHYLDIESGIFYDCETGEVAVPLTQEEMEAEIRDCGLYHAKAKNLLGMCHMLTQRFNSVIPDDIKTLMELPGVGQKTANVIASIIYNIPALAVDTHVFRVSHRLGLAKGKDPLATEKELEKIIPREKWSDAHHWFIWHGRKICKARKPLCRGCVVVEECPFKEKNFE